MEVFVNKFIGPISIGGLLGVVIIVVIMVILATS